MTAPSSAQPTFRADAQAIIDAVERLAASEQIDIENVDDLDGKAHAVILPRDKKLESLKPLFDAFRKKPERRKGTVTLNTEQSFIDMVKRFADPKLTAIFAKRDFRSPSLLAVFDYHEQGKSDVNDAQWLSHRARYPFPLSKEWKRWFEKNEHVLGASDFATFVEDNIRDIAVLGTDPDADAEMRKLADLVGGSFASPSQLIDLSRSLQVNVSSAVKNAITLSSGEITVAYQEVHNDGEGRPIKVPNLFIIGIPIFDGGDRYRIAARLRYRLSGGTITWSYSLVQPEASFDHAFDETVALVKEATTLPIFYGEPEGNS